MFKNYKIIIIIILIILLILIGILVFNKPKDNKCKDGIYTPKIRPKINYVGGPFSKNNEKNVFPKNPNFIQVQNAKLWGPPLAPPFPKYPWPPSL